MSVAGKEYPAFEPLHRNHDRAAFCCAYPEFNTFLKHMALQQAKRKVCAVTVLLVDGPTRIAGYHTLSAGALTLGELPPKIARAFPRYSEGLPATLIGRLAVDDDYRGQGWGEALLMNALSRCLSASETIASAFVIVRAFDRAAMGFYKRYGFESYPSDPRRMYLPMRTIMQLI